MTAALPRTVPVWGHIDCPPPSEPGAILWSRFAEREDQVSLPSVVHGDRVGWKAQYAQWMRSVGQSYACTPQARRFQDHHAGLSYWWMTLPTQFTFTRESTSYAVLRLMALVDTLVRVQPTAVRLDGLPAEVIACLEPWCRERGITVELSESAPCACRPPAAPTRGGRADALRHLMSSYTRHGRSKAAAPSAGPVIVDYFDNVRPQADAYDSQYWGPLAALLDGDGAAQWRHIDVRSTALPTPASARALAQKLAPVGRHALVKDAMSAQVLRRSMGTLRRIEAIGRDSWPAVSFVDRPRGVDARALVADAWRDCHAGTTAAVNALDIHLMDALAAAADGPALYLLENQAWEMALLHAWRRHRTSPIAGFVHSLARDWDLRYALPSCGPVDDALPPMPDQCLVGSAHEAAILVEDGYAASMIVEVEAVRFLGGDAALRQPAPASGPTRLLVLGEYDLHSNGLLIQALHAGDLEGLAVNYRPHPSRHAAASVLPAGVALSTQPVVTDALAQCDAVVGMGTSTAVLTAVQSGVPVITLQDATVLDGSVVDLDSVLQVPASARIDLGLIERAIDAAGRATTRREQHSDPALPRWRAWRASRS